MPEKDAEELPGEFIELLQAFDINVTQSIILTTCPTYSVTPAVY
jgi:hypothetical protein